VSYGRPASADWFDKERRTQFRSFIAAGQSDVQREDGRRLFVSSGTVTGHRQSNAALISGGNRRLQLDAAPRCVRNLSCAQKRRPPSHLMLVPEAQKLDGERIPPENDRRPVSVAHAYSIHPRHCPCPVMPLCLEATLLLHLALAYVHFTPFRHVARVQIFSVL